MRCSTRAHEEESLQIPLFFRKEDLESGIRDERLGVLYSGIIENGFPGELGRDADLCRSFPKEKFGFMQDSLQAGFDPIDDLSL